VKVDINEVVKTFNFFVSSLQHSVQGRIYKRHIDCGNFNYFWDISHYYRPNQNAKSIYVPTTTSVTTAAEAENLLLSYAQAFTDIDVTPNKFF
jgi:hypothetical protein